MKYIKLTDESLRDIFNLLSAKFSKRPNDKIKFYLDYVTQYYPKTACSLVVSYNSEYNDNTYDFSVQYVGVYDENGNELLPLKNKAKEARSEWHTFDCPPGEFDEEANKDLVVYLKDVRIPDLYFGEKDV